MKPLIHLEGKIAIVTGGSRGIGEAIARTFAAHGAKVAICARKAEALERVAQSIQADGGEVLAMPVHTGDAEARKKLVEATIAKFGKVDVLVNNAATNPYYGPFLKVETAAWDKTFDTNLRGYFEMARLVAQHLIDRKAPGSIINIGSTQGLVGAENEGVYAMTKAAIFSMTRTLAVELGKYNIRVNALAPGLVDTKFSSAVVNNPEFLNKVLTHTPLGRIGRPEDLAGPALLLASDASAWITGTVLPIEGGVTVNVK